MTTPPGPEGSALRHEVEGPRVEDALYQAFPNQPTIFGTDPLDGMPRQIVSTPLEDALAPALSIEKQVCMADTRGFVTRDEWGNVVATYEPESVDRTPSGRYRLRVADFREVSPVRPQCKHYVRQQLPFPENPEYRLTVRLCTARRTDEGEFLDVGNTQILACELRLPSIGSNAEAIDRSDAETIRKREEEQVADDFDVDRALAQTKKEDE